MKKKLVEISRFIIVGGLSFVIDYGLLIFLTEFIDMHYLISGGISFVLSVIINYFLCAKWVFKAVNRRNSEAMLLFIITSLIGLLLNQIVMWLLVEKFNIYYAISKMIATILVMIWNYIMKRKSLVKE